MTTLYPSPRRLPGLHRKAGALAPLFAVGLLAAASAPAVAQEEEPPLNLFLQVGYEYDDDITVDAIDVTSRVGDTSYRFRGRLGLSLYDKDRTSLAARYSFFQSLYDDLTAFDLQMHGFSMRGKTRLGKANLGMTYRYDYIFLGGEDFQDVHTIRPDLGILIARRTYLTAHYEYRNVSFQQVRQQERDAERHSLGAKLYFLMGDGRNITTSYIFSRHNARNDAFTFTGHRADIGLKIPASGSDMAPVFRLRYQYRLRDYSAITPSIGEVREDRRHQVRAGFEVPLTSSLEAEFQYRHDRSLSNLESVDFISNEVRVSLGWTF